MSLTRIIVMGKHSGLGPVEHSIASAIQLLQKHVSVVVCESEDSANYQLHHGSEELDTPLVQIIDAKDEAACQAVFRIHVKMRVRKPGFEPWHGGLVALAIDPSGATALRRQKHYDKVSGHCVVPPPVCLLNVLQQCRKVGYLYPRYWQDVVERLGLQAFWDFLQSAKMSLAGGNTQECTDSLKLAMAQVIEEGVLRYLLPHAEVMRRIETEDRKLLSLSVDDPTSLAEIVNEITSIMSDYKLREYL